LAKKYHPDNYASNSLEDLAREKMSEINQAYDEVMSIKKEEAEKEAQYRRQEYHNNDSYSSSGYSSQYSSHSDIRSLINRGKIYEADELLNGTASASRDSEWHFLKGTVSYSKGNLDDAFQYFETAVNMNPSSPEYAAALNRLKAQSASKNIYQNGGYRAGGASACSGCDLCSGLLLADCCCECMGGDLIGCC
jgi:curved DNA-binding protein CbpA